MAYSFYQLCWFFLIYSFMGWSAGVIVNAVRKHRFVDTGFMGMPFCPSYGIGAVLVCIFLPELRNQPFFLLLGGAVIGALVCILTGFLLERIFHRKWWDYSKYRFQFEGYISIWLLVSFGAGTLFVMYIGNPLIVRILAWIPVIAGRVILMVLYLLMAIDFAASLIAVLELKIRLRRVEQLAENMQKVTGEFGNAITGRIQKRMMRAYPNLEAGKIKAAERSRTPKEVFAQGYGFYKLFWLFFIGAFLGDIAETIFCRIKMGVWMSRSSVVYGPFSLVWGLGCAILSALLYKYKGKSDRAIFLAGTVLGGAYEYICSVLSELVFGTIFWDYSKIPFNLGGRINLLYCFFWGFAAIAWLKFFCPKLSALIEKLPMKPGVILTWICVVFMVINSAISGLAFMRYTERQKTEMGMLAEETGEDTFLDKLLDEHFSDERMERIYPNAKIVKD